MTTTLSRVREGLLWEELICLDCGELSDSPDDLCPNCGGWDVYACSMVLAIMEKIEGDEG